jgi:SAM-dependent methyltransferase
MSDGLAQGYTRAFTRFMAHTDQAAVFLREVGGYVARHRVASVLDIGAGNGALAIPLSRRVRRYVAVERDPGYVRRLREHGVEVVAGAFPVPVDGVHDLVVMSHALSYEEENHHDMLRAAWELVAPGGRLLVVVHRGGPDTDWGRLLAGAGMGGFVGPLARSLDELVPTLSAMGPLETRDVVTTVAAGDVRDMVELLSFVAPRGEQEEFLRHGAELTGLLDRGHRTASGYSFPFRNAFLCVRRDQPGNS